MKYKNTLIKVEIKGKERQFKLLKDIQHELRELLISINSTKNEDFNKIKKMVSKIETNSDLNFYFLKLLKMNNLTYKENGETWDYDSNFNMLKETLTSKQFQNLTNMQRPNQLIELQKILQDIIKNKACNHQYIKIELNFPLITGIEGLRIDYYKSLVLGNFSARRYKAMENYINNLDKDYDIIKYSLDETNFCPKIYLLILTLTKTFCAVNADLILNYFLKNVAEEEKEGKDSDHIKRQKNGSYLVKTQYEQFIIEKKEDYYLYGLEEEIRRYENYPLKILLFRNESFRKFLKDKRKGFLGTLHLYDYFISYIKEFIKSRSFIDLINENTCYNNIYALLKNENYIEEMLDDIHFQFLPFYGTENYFGFTNKDLEISLINIIPEIAADITIGNENEIENITNLCLLFSIAVKFITSLHEFIIHLTYGYLHYLTGKELSAHSKKGSIDKNDGGNFFESKLTGGFKFEFLNINNVVNLLDGVSINKSLKDFQKDVTCGLDIKTLIQRQKNNEFQGFLSEFLKKFKIDFSFFEDYNLDQVMVSCRMYEKSQGIILKRYGVDCYGGGKSIYNDEEE